MVYHPCFDDNGVPLALGWSVENVSEWVSTELNLAKYKECFQRNFINGKKLIFIDSSTLPKIGVTDFEDIQFLSKSIRDILGLEKPFWNRSIALPPRDSITLFLERKAHSGCESAGLTFEEHVRYLENYNQHKQ